MFPVALLENKLSFGLGGELQGNETKKWMSPGVREQANRILEESGHPSEFKWIRRRLKTSETC